MSRKLYVALVLMPVLAGTDAHALGLGGMRLQSALDQPFVGEIDLVDVKPDELDAIKVQIAPQAEFNRAGTERYHHLTKLRFSPQISPRGDPVIRVASREPMREPYMDFLVEALWPKGRLVKQYTLLLDPPVTASRSAPRIEAPVIEARPAAAPEVIPAPRPASAQVQTQPPVKAAKPSPSASPVPEDAPRAASVPVTSGGFPKRYGPVRPGTGLWRLARANTPAGATVSQTAMALYRNNQDAFVNGNINRLIAGRTLILPHAGELFALSPEAAAQEFQTALTGGKVRRTPLTDPNAPPADEGDSRLRIAGAAPGANRSGAGRSGAGATAAQGMERDILLARETSESARQETVEMRGRIRDLETQLAEIQQLLRLRNEELARAQGAGPAVAAMSAASQSATKATAPTDAASETGAPADGASVSKPVTAVGSPPPSVPTDLRDTSGVPHDQASLPGAIDSTPSPDAPREPLTDAGASAPVEGAGPAGTSRPAPSSPEAAVVPPAAPPPVARTEPQPDSGVGAPVPAATPQPSRAGAPGSAPAGAASKPPSGAAGKVSAAAPSADSTWRALLLPLAGVAGLTALGIGALTWVRSRRRIGRDSSVDFDSSDLSDATSTRSAQEPPMTAAARRAATATVSADTEESAAADTPSSAFMPTVGGEAETDEADAISEADIYIAYGRYREAEDLLQEEIRRTPTRLDLKFKLAEAYYGAKNTDALRALMQEMQAAGGNRANPEQWQRLVDMAAGAQPALAQGDSAPSPIRPPGSSIVAAALARAPAQGGVGRLGRDSDVLVESIDPGSAEVYTLDISDAQKPSADLALQGDSGPASGFGAAAGPRPDAAPLGRDTPASGPISNPISHPISIESPAGYVEPALLDDQMFSRELGLEAPRSSQSTAGSAGTGSDLNLHLEEPRSGGDLELYSVIDSGPRSADIQEANRAGIEVSGLLPPSSYPRSKADVNRASGRSGGLLGAQEDSASSDLLSSQWQVDSGLWDETATKLDLARAYIEMGDKEAARGILEEVGGEGSEEQRAEARELLRRVG